MADLGGREPGKVQSPAVTQSTAAASVSLPSATETDKDCEETDVEPEDIKGEAGDANQYTSTEIPNPLCKYSNTKPK